MRSTKPAISSRISILLTALGLTMTGLLLAGCGVFRASGQLGPDLKPRFGTSVSVPFGQ
jgi:hypothetical protein